MSLKISQKGLILVAVPLIFELGFVIALACMLDQAKNEARLQAKAKAMVVDAEQLDHMLLKTAYLAITWKATHSPVFVHQYEEIAANVPGILADMNAQSRTDEEREQVDKLKNQCKKILEVTSNFLHSHDSGMLLLMRREGFRADAERVYNELLEQVRTLTLMERDFQSGVSKAEDRSEAAIKFLMMATLVFNIGLTIGMSIYFSKSITQRLSLIVENTKLVASGKPLEEPIPGDDEISTLDGFLHEMSNTLQEIEIRKQAYVSMITHDLKAPLTSLQMALTLIQTGADERADEAERKRLRNAHSNVSLMVNLVNDLLDLDKLEAGALHLDLEPVRLTDSIGAAKNVIDSLSQEYGVDISVQIANTTIEADKRRVEQILINLLSNAIKFSPRGGTVRIIQEADEEWATVSIEDDGRGINEEDQATIFDRFKQADREDSSLKGGTGLGLSICKALVELHHGEIGVISSEGKGSTFWFKLPIEQPA
jgi:signal transduction histidine kinase